MQPQKIDVENVGAWAGGTCNKEVATVLISLFRAFATIDNSAYVLNT